MDRQESVATGRVQFIWDSSEEGQMLLNIDPDQTGAPNAFELEGELRDKIVDIVSEGDRIEITYVQIEYEVVDPDSGPSERLKPHITDIKVLN